MTYWWTTMHTFQQVLFVIACATTLFMIIQIIMVAVGSGDGDTTYDADTSVDDGDVINDGGAGFTVFGLRILSVRSIIAFFAIGSWLTYALFYVIGFWSILPGVVAGLAAAVGIAAFMRAISKMQQDGTLDVHNTVGKVADVYLTIPAAREGSGKINVYVQERLAELDAITDAPAPIKTGSKVKIAESVNDGLVLVEPFSVHRPDAPTDDAPAEAENSTEG